MLTKTFQLTSPAFADGDIIPDQYTCQGDNISPEFVIRGVPAGAASLLLIVHDPDAPYGDYIHWTLWNINPTIGRIREDKLPAESVQGVNGFGHVHYDGPCPPSGIHHYKFDLYALDSCINLPEGAPEEDVRLMINEHAIAKTTLTGRFGAHALA